MGFGDFVHGVGDAVKNTAKIGGAVASHTLNPTKWDNAARWVGDHGDEVAKAGWDIAKDQVNPMKADFWINAATIGLSAATGGAAAAPLMAGRAALAARTGEAVVDAARIGSEVAEVARAGSTAAKAAEGVGVIGKAREAYEAGNVVRSASPTIQRAEKFVDALATSRRSNLVTGAREALGMNPLSMGTRARVGLSNTLMKAGEAEAGVIRTTAARAIAGQSAIKPSLRVGAAAAKAGNYADDAWRVGRLTTRANQARGAIKGVEVMADPEGAAMDYAMKKTSAGNDFKGEHTRLEEPQNNAVGAAKSFDPLSQPMKVNQPSSMMSNSYMRSAQSSPVSGRSTGSSSVGAPYQAGRGFSTTKGVSGALQPSRSLTSSASEAPEIYDPYKASDESLEQPMEVRDPYKRLSPAGGR